MLSSLANHRIDTDLSRHIGLNSQGACIVSQLFRSSPAHSAAPIVTALILAAAAPWPVAGSLQVICEQVYGTIGVVFTLLTWFIAIGGDRARGRRGRHLGPAQRPLREHQDRIIGLGT